MAKNSAFEQGLAKGIARAKQCIVVSKEFWENEARAYAHGHFSTSAAQAKFVEGWMHAGHPPFVQGDRVKLIVRIMNYGDPKVIERKMYDLVFPYANSRIDFIEETNICFKYEVETSVIILNRCGDFFRQRQVNFKVVTGSATTQVN